MAHGLRCAGLDIVDQGYAERGLFKMVEYGTKLFVGVQISHERVVAEFGLPADCLVTTEAA